MTRPTSSAELLPNCGRKSVEKVAQKILKNWEAGYAGMSRLTNKFVFENDENPFLMFLFSLISPERFGVHSPPLEGESH